MSRPRFNHAFDIAFEVQTDNPADKVTNEEPDGPLSPRGCGHPECQRDGNAAVILPCRFGEEGGR